MEVILTHTAQSDELATDALSQMLLQHQQQGGCGAQDSGRQTACVVPGEGRTPGGGGCCQVEVCPPLAPDSLPWSVPDSMVVDTMSNTLAINQLQQLMGPFLLFTGVPASAAGGYCAYP